VRELHRPSGLETREDKIMKGALGIPLLLSVLLCEGALAQARTIKLAVAPDYSQEQAAEVYKPFVAYLKKATGYNIELVTARNYSIYWSDMRSKKGWDLVFDEAHFTDYRVQFYKFEPLVRSAESSSYSLLTQDDIGVGNTKALLAENILTLSAPSLGYALLLQYFPNPMQQPDIRTTVASWNDAVDAVFADEGRAAMVPSSMTALYANMFEVVKTREYPGAAISASPALDAATKAKIKEALLKMHENDDAFQALTELRISQFVPASAAEYKGSGDILKGFYGYGQ
jgi:ABC-type phosphate/phosphonate transport system substrate-binding protein